MHLAEIPQQNFVPGGMAYREILSVLVIAYREKQEVCNVEWDLAEVTYFHSQKCCYI